MSKFHFRLILNRIINILRLKEQVAFQGIWIIHEIGLNAKMGVQGGKKTRAPERNSGKVFLYNILLCSDRCSLMNIESQS